MEITLKYGDITEAIISCAMRVHQKMKNGFVENIYQRCLAIKFEKKGLRFIQEQEINIYYEGIRVEKRRVDLVEGKTIIAIKALSELTDTHLAQGLNHLEAHSPEIGPLINFGAKRLQSKRLSNRQKLRPLKNSANPVNP